MTIRPIRLQLSRVKGFSLQRLSMETNGLAAVKVDRSTGRGNLYQVGLVACSCRTPGECTHNMFRVETAEEAVAVFREWAKLWRPCSPHRKALPEIRGKNLACWCKPGAPCHAGVLLEIANA